MRIVILAGFSLLAAPAIAQDLVPGFQGTMIEAPAPEPVEEAGPALQRDILLDLDGDKKPEQIMHFAEDCTEDGLCAWIVLPGNGMAQAMGGHARQIMQAPAGRLTAGEGYINADGILYTYDAGQVFPAGDLIGTNEARPIPTTDSMAGRVADAAGFGPLDPSLIRTWRIDLDGDGKGASGTVSILPGNTMANGAPWVILDQEGKRLAGGWSIDWPRIYAGPTLRVISITAYGMVETTVENAGGQP